jgi:hypothetical protein
MPGGRREAEIRFYVDADLLGLAKILVAVRADVTYPGDPGGKDLSPLAAAMSYRQPRHQGP